MSMTMHLDIVSAENELFSGTVIEVIAPAIMGEVGIFPRHTQMISPLKPGEVRFKNEQGEEQSIYVSGGVLEVQPHVVTVLSDTAIRAADLDEQAALEAKKRAEEALADQQGEFDIAQAQSQLIEAAAQLRMIESIRKNMKH